MNENKLLVSVVIPTLDRGKILCETIEQFINLSYPNIEIIIVDQTESHPPNVLEYLNRVKDSIRYHQISTKGLTHARNLGVKLSKGEIVLFCDDDVIPSPNLIEAHASNYIDESIAGVAGRVVEFDNHKVKGKKIGKITPCGRYIGNFNSSERAWVDHATGCNMSFRKEAMIKAGSFDDAYSGNALFEDTDFSYRIRQMGYQIIFDPFAQLNHLAISNGGCQTRSQSQASFYYNFIRNKTIFFYKNLNILFFPCFYGTIFIRAVVTGLIQERSIRDFFLLAVTAPMDGYKAYKFR